MSRSQQMDTGRSPAYSTSGDFCRLFDEQMNGLYLLSFLLTTDHDKAGQCFVSGMTDCVDGNPVFKEWALSWARRAIIQSAIRLVAPHPDRERSTQRPLYEGTSTAMPSKAAEDVAFGAVVQLEAFERFVFVMSTLERYSDQECSLLLGCSRREVAGARLRALRQIADRKPSEREEQTEFHARQAAFCQNREAPLEATIALS
jgi:hypothetical protein